MSASTTNTDHLIHDVHDQLRNHYGEHALSIVKVAAKGQFTLPIELRRKLRIGKGDDLSVEAECGILMVRKVRKRKLLGSSDPISGFIGTGKWNQDWVHRS